MIAGSISHSMISPASPDNRGGRECQRKLALVVWRASSSVLILMFSLERRNTEHATRREDFGLLYLFHVYISGFVRQTSNLYKLWPTSVSIPVLKALNMAPRVLRNSSTTPKNPALPARNRPTTCFKTRAVSRAPRKSRMHSPRRR